MNAKPGDVAIIVGGPPLNLGKLVYVLGRPDDPRMPSLGERKGPRMGVQMSANPLIATDGEEVFGGSIAESCLVSLGVHGDLAELVREGGMMKVVECALMELDDEDKDAEDANIASRPCYFVTDIASRDEVPDGALSCGMPSWCAAKLKAHGYPEPVPFSVLTGKYWCVRMDAAATYSQFEPGRATTEEVISTEQIRRVLGEYFVKVVAGPFDSRDDALTSYPSSPAGPS